MEVVSAGGTDAGAHISGGTQDVFGTASGVTIFTGSQVVEAGRTAISTIISGGTQLGEISLRWNAGRRSESYWPKLTAHSALVGGGGGSVDLVPMGSSRTAHVRSSLLRKAKPVLRRNSFMTRM
jgi:autotransporter passenger strand-loop-strand repeat protein